MNRSTSRDSSFRGIDISPTSSNSRSLTSVVTPAQPLTGTGQSVLSSLLRVHSCAHPNYFYPDAASFYESPFFGNTSADVGGWGDPNNDNQITTGGFKDVIRAYPTPHHIMRNFTEFPFANPSGARPFANDPTAPAPPATLAMNSTMTKANVDFIVNGFVGDFVGFHSYIESLNVSPILPRLASQ